MIGSSFIAKIRTHLVDDARHCWKWASLHWAIVSGGVAAYCADPNNWSTISSTLYSIPGEYRVFVPAGIGFLVAFVPIALRMWKQGKGKTNA